MSDNKVDTLSEQCDPTPLWTGRKNIVFEYREWNSYEVATINLQLEKIYRRNGKLYFDGLCLPEKEHQHFRAANIYNICIDGGQINKNEFITDLGVVYHGGYSAEKPRFKNGTACFTGTFYHGDRKEVESYTESKGFNATHSVSANTDYLIIGEELHGDKTTYSLSKIKKALELGVKILTEDELYNLLEQ
jgi:NAD-dependent DNA ligase